MSPSAINTLPNFANPGKVVTRPSALAHIVLRAWDFPKMKDFWVTFLNAKIQMETPFAAFLTYDEEHHRIALFNGGQPGKNAPTDTTLMHVSFTFASLADLLLAYRQRLQHGIKPVWCVNHGPTITLYYADPEGNRIETQYDVFETSEEANAYLTGPEFAENPLGVDFDPDEIIKRLEAGEDEKVLTKRANIGPRGMDSVPEAMRT